MSDNELDNLFKEAAGEFKAPNDPSAWQDMARKLDQAVVVTSFWNWKTISSLTVVGVTGIAFILYLSMPGYHPEKITATDSNVSKVIGKENTQSKPTGSDMEANDNKEANSTSAQNLKEKNGLASEVDQNKKDDQNRKDDQGKNGDQSRVGDRSKIEDQNKIEDQSKKNDQSRVGDQSEKDSQRKSNALPVESTNKSKSAIPIAIGAKANSPQGENLAETQTKTAQQKGQSSKQNSPEENQTSVATNSVNNKNEVVSSTGKTEQVILGAEVAVAEKSLDSKKSSNAVIEENSNQSISNAKAANLQSEKFAVDIDSLKKEEEKKKLVTNTLVSKTEEQPEEKEEKSEVMNRFAIKLAISPDYSMVKSATPNSLGINYGVLVEYRLNKNWSVATGGIWSKKIYSAIDVEYNGYHADWVDGDCRMWDIPINVYYSFPSRKAFSFYASVGLSSYLMKEENYVYYVESSYGTYDYAKQVKGENNEWFKTLNLSAGMQFRMNKIFSLQFEPTLKAPLAGVGEGEVSLVSLGAFLNLRFDLPINKSVRNEE